MAPFSFFENDTRKFTHIQERYPGQQTPLLDAPHTLPFDIQSPHLPLPLLRQPFPHLLDLTLPKSQQLSLFHLNPRLEGKLRLYGFELILVAEEAELDTVVSGMAYDIVSARADFVKQVRCAWREVADWGGGGVGAADANRLVHVAHGND